MPRATVLMPVYNGGDFLTHAMDSVLSQTFRDFELLVIDDCSTDKTPAVLDHYAKRDSRVQVVRNERNLGIVETLNRGLNMAQHDYIIRMDADDFSYPDRFAKQIAYMDAHPDVGLLGAKYIHIDERGGYVFDGQPMPPEPEPGTRGYTHWKLLWMTSIQHPSAVLRREVIKQNHLRYDADYFTAEDYDLWTRIRRVSAVERLPDTLLDYRVNTQGISVQKREKQLQTHFAITHRELERLLGESVDRGIAWRLFRVVVPGTDIPDFIPPGDAASAAELLLRVRSRYLAEHHVNDGEHDYIDFMVRQGLLRLLPHARGDADVQRRLRLIILRHAPVDFLKLTGRYVTHRLRKAVR